MQTYAQFIKNKTQFGSLSGFDPLSMPSCLFPFQAHLVEWSLRKGRAAVFADCGLGKSIIQLVWADNVVRKTNRPVLVLTPLAVSQQTVREAEKFGIEAVRSNDGRLPGRATIVVTNYERLAHFSPDDFDGVVCDESSILKNFDGSTRAAITEFMRTRPYRLLCTATAAPNDYVELGTSSECIGELGYQDMITRFFKQETSKDHLGWGRTKYRIRGHAETDFWRWICSWSRAVRKPSDLGFDDVDFKLPQLNVETHVVTSNMKRPGFLIDLPAITLEEQREERRRTIPERCEKAADLVSRTKKPAVVWCHLNDEGDLLTQSIRGAVQVSGADKDEAKEEAFEGFANGQIRVLVTKPSIAGFGLNWQHCNHQTFFPSHSFEQWYQSVRRCWRFGQKNPVTVDVVTSEGEASIIANMQRKADAANEMFANLVRLMNESMSIDRSTRFHMKEVCPQWLA